MSCNSFVHGIEFQSPDGKYIASGAIDGIINIFDVAYGKVLRTLEGRYKKFQYIIKIIIKIL